MGTVVTLIILLIVIGFSIWGLVRRKRSGKSCCSDCSRCKKPC